MVFLTFSQNEPKDQIGEMGDHASDFEIETTKHDTTNKSEIGPKRICSPVLVEAIIPLVSRSIRHLIVDHTRSPTYPDFSY